MATVAELEAKVANLQRATDELALLLGRQLGLYPVWDANPGRWLLLDESKLVDIEDDDDA